VRRGEAAILEAITQLHGEMSQLRLAVSTRLDTLIDAVAELRHDFDSHTHDGEA
jgi:hypothetical protein